MAPKRSRTDHSRLVEDLHARLDERLAALTTSDDWLDYLAAARTFYRYSPNNQLLLALQGAEGHVASYNTWQRIPATGGGMCQVAKGEKGLTILAPMTAKSVDIDDDTGEETTIRRLRGFRTVKVFHQGQLIEPPAIGERVLPELLTGENRWQHVWAAVAGRLEADGFDVTRHTRSPVEKWNGLTSWPDRKVLVADDLQPPQALKTLLHEWGHVELDHEHRTELERPIKEVEAESVAYLLAQTVGLDSGAYSVPYITVWAGGDIDTVRRAAEQILTTTKRLVECLETDLGIELAPDLVERAIVSAEASVVPLRPDRSGTNVVPLPEPAPESHAVPQQESLPLPGLPGNPPDSPASVIDIEDRRFLKAMIDDLEPDQREHFMALVYDPCHAGDAAAILAESGKTAGQIARLMHRLHFDVDTIRDALLCRVDDLDRPTLFSVADTRSALLAVDDSIDIDDLVPLVERPSAEIKASAPESGHRLDDLRLIQRAIRRSVEPSKVAALAYGLDLEPVTVIGVCRATSIRPQDAMAVAIALRNGDARTAFADVNAAWPDVEGGWERHSHPSLRGATSIAAVPDYDPTREILDRWMGRTRPALAPAPSSGAGVTFEV